MTPTTLRFFGSVFLVAAAVVSILNLKRVADLGAPYLALPLLIIGIALMVRARRGRL